MLRFRKIVCLIERELVEKNPYLASALINIYAKCGMLSKAQEVHEDLPIRSIYSWNAMIGGYAYNEEGYKALDCFEQMQKEGFLPNVITFLCILRVCGSTKAVDKGKQVHEEISTRVFLSKIVSCLALLW
jgi:pentatricopeptide repeat protein